MASPASSQRPDLRVEKALWRSGTATVIAGADEVGRGCLAGPVSVGMVALTADARRAPPGLADSKLLSAAAREKLVPAIKAWAHASAVGHASAAEIDELGIMAALCLAGQRAYGQLSLPPDMIILDGNYDWLTRPAAQRSLFAPPSFPDGVPAAVKTRIKADLTCASVAAASVLAKVARDDNMVGYSRRHPGYGWEVNAGYATAEHRQAISTLGVTDLHRRSWNLGSSTVAQAT